MTEIFITKSCFPPPTYHCKIKITRSCEKEKDESTFAERKKICNSSRLLAESEIMRLWLLLPTDVVYFDDVVVGVSDNLDIIVAAKFFL